MTRVTPEPLRPIVPLGTVIRQWARIGAIGFGGPPAHIALLRALCVEERQWLTAHEFEDGIAATNMLPGPASTQLAIYCAWRLRGRLGAIVGGLCFILPGLAVILALSALFLAHHPARWVLGLAAGAGAAVPAVAVSAAVSLIPASWRRAGAERPARARWMCFLVAGAVAASTVGSLLVLVLVGCGLLEVVVRARRTNRVLPTPSVMLMAAGLPALAGGIAALCWVAFKVGALSYGGGFVIIPLMQHDAVVTYHWMTGTQFLDAVVLGQVTPGPVVQTVAVVGYAAAGVWGGLLAAAIAFAPSFVFVIAGARHFDRLRSDRRVQAFFVGAGAAVIGAIAGSGYTLSLELAHLWQAGVVALSAITLLVWRRGVVAALVGAALLGLIAVLAGAPV